MRPAFGMTLPVELVQVRDGDTVKIKVPHGHEWVIRVRECWCAEKHTDFGKLATEVAKALLNRADELVWHIPLPRDPVHLLKNLTFDRVPSDLWIDDVPFADEMISLGFAFKTKDEQREHEAKWDDDEAYRTRLQAIAREEIRPR